MDCDERTETVVSGIRANDVNIDNIRDWDYNLITSFFESAIVWRK